VRGYARARTFVVALKSGHEKGGRLPNQETDVRRFIFEGGLKAFAHGVFPSGVASLLGKLAYARQFFYRETRNPRGKYPQAM